MRTRTLLVGLGLTLAAPAHAGVLYGVVTDKGTKEPLAGTTVVITGDASVDGSSQTTITEDDGSFRVTELPAGTYLITYFYGETTIERRGVVLSADGEIELHQAIDTSYREVDYCCCFGFAVPPLYDGAPADHTDRDPADVRLLRVQDHLGLARLDARLEPRHTATTVGGALRLPGAPAIASELLASVATASTAPGAARPGATGGVIEATLRRGTNEHEGRAALQLGPRSRFMARDSGDWDRDHAWWSTGVVLERASGRDGSSGRHGAQVLLGLDAMAGPGDAVGMGMVGLATWTPDGGRDLWGDLHTTLKADDNKREISFGISAEALTTGADAAVARIASPTGAPELAAIDRVAGRLGLTQRGKWHGNHTVTVGGELGFGHADDVEHGDLQGYLGDEWVPRPNWTITSGVRWDRRELGPAMIDAVLPRLSVAYDPSEEGTRSWFATAERIAALDQDRLGGWRTAPAVGVDQASIGYTRDWLDDLRVTIAGRARRAIGVDDAPVERGAEAAVRWLPERRFAGELTASSLTRRLVAQASYTIKRGRNDLAVAAVTELGVDEHHWGGSLAIARSAPYSYDEPEALRIPVRLALELFDLDDARARGGRLAMSADW